MQSVRLKLHLRNYSWKLQTRDFAELFIGVSFATKRIGWIVIKLLRYIECDAENVDV